MQGMIYDREQAASWPDFGGFYCIVCGKPNANAHHIPPIGTGRRDRWQGAIVRLCGSGTTGCHGAFHAGKLELRYTPDGWEWRGESSPMDGRPGLIARRWTPCHDDDFWSWIQGFN